jgi:hypothetical protein
MKGKPDLVKARRIKEAAKKVGSVYVVATRNLKLPQEENASAHLAGYPLAEYSCKECATVFHANAGMNAHCITCGSSKTVCSHKSETAKAKGVKLHADADLATYECASCATLNVMHSAVEVAANKSLHCVTCGHKNIFVSKATAELDAPAGDELDDLELVDTSDDVVSELEDLPLIDEPVGDDDSEMPIADADEMPPPESNQPSVTLSPPVDPPMEDDFTSVEYSEEDDILDSSEDMMDVDLMDSAEDVPLEELSLVWIRDKLAIATANQIIATLSEADAGKNADIMQTQEFATSIGFSIEKEGLAKTCKSFGFKPVIAKLSIKKLVEAKVKAEMASKAKELDEKLTAVADDFGQATEIAAAGVVKNFWNNVQDPLKAAMIAELSSVGIRSPNKLVDRVWEVNASKLLRIIIDKAKELSAKSETARNELAEILDSVKYVPTKVTAEAEDDSDTEDEEKEDDDEDGEDTVESRLSAAAKPIKTDAVVVAGKFGGGRSAIRSILGGRQNHFNS